MPRRGHKRKLHEASSTDKLEDPQDEEDVPSKIMPCQLPPKEVNAGSFTLPCTIGSLNFYDIADLAASVNVIPKIVGNVLVKNDKFLFPSDFVVIDMLEARYETMILSRPFLATIHAEINDFNKEISLGIGKDRITFDIDKKIHNLTTPVKKVHERCGKKARIDKADPSIHKKVCNGGEDIYGINEKGKLREWYCCHDDKRRGMTGEGYHSLDLLLVKYGGSQEIDQLTDEYELGIGKKGHILEEIWENYKEVQGDDTYWWYDHWLEEHKKQEIWEEV
ncbi:hypothetical protein Tco_1546573 [Tanacetum coccineum]